MAIFNIERMRIRYNRLLTVLLVFCTFISCTKNALDKPVDSTNIAPESVSDFQAMLDDQAAAAIASTCLTDVLTDDIDIRNNPLSGEITGNSVYYWSKDMFSSNVTVNEWDEQYNAIFIANTVLEQIDNAVADSLDRNAVKGRALLLRGVAFLSLSCLWAPAYDPATATTDMGIQLRLNTSQQTSSKRENMQQTYQQIISDLQTASTLLPDVDAYNQAARCRPSKAAAYGYLARVHLLMKNYAMSLSYAKQSLQLYSSLLDYNTLDSTSNYPLVTGASPASNTESVLYLYNTNLLIYSSYTIRIDSSLIRQYTPGDLRRSMYFYKSSYPAGVAFKGVFSKGYPVFTGMATDELYLMIAEAMIRTGNLEGGLQQLNSFLSTRYITAGFTPLTATDTISALLLIMQERRKELVLRGMRWQDIRRMNQETDTRLHTTLVRTIDNITYTLHPGSPRFTLPIPDYIIKLNGMTQNP